MLILIMHLPDLFILYISGGFLAHSTVYILSGTFTHIQRNGATRVSPLTLPEPDIENPQFYGDWHGFGLSDDAETQ